MIIHTSEIAISKLPQVQLDSSFPLRDVVHMVLAGGPSQTLYNLETGMHQRAVEYLCRDAKGAIAEDDRGNPYFVMDQPHRPNETLGIFSVAGVRFESVQIQTSRGNDGTVRDIADAAMNSYREDAREKSWSLMLFSVYPGVTAEWHNERGELQSVERILEIESERPYGDGSCFGTHRLEGIAFALRRFCLENDVEPSQLDGVWLNAFHHLQGAIEMIKNHQRDDGSLQRTWFRKNRIPTAPLELREALKDVASIHHRDAALVYVTGHCLDAISPMVEFFHQDQEWIQSACYILAQTIENHWTAIGRDIRPLTHAIHALKLLDV
jgi:hypothetical protein